MCFHNWTPDLDSEEKSSTATDPGAERGLNDAIFYAGLNCIAAGVILHLALLTHRSLRQMKV